MGLNIDIKIQLEGFSSEQLRWWVDTERTWLRQVDKALANKEKQLASAGSATDEDHNPMPPETVTIIEAGNKPVFHGYPDATDPSDPNYSFGLFQRIPDIENPVDPNPII